MDIGAIGSAMLNTTSFDAAPDAGMARMSSFQLNADAGQPGINHNGLSLNSDGQPLDGVRSAIGQLLEQRRMLPGAAASDNNSLVRVIDPAQPSGMMKEVGQSAAATPSALGNYASVMEYATNVALVGMALHGVTRGVSTLTSKGG